MRIAFLGSSSAGNCAVLEAGSTRILLDAGLSGKQIRERLATLGVGIETIQAVIITHEHADHILGLRGLACETHLEYYANASTAEAVRRSLSKDLRWRMFETGSTFRLRDLEISTFATPHDASEPVGLLIQAYPDELHARRLGWLTDLGHIPQHVADRMREVDYLVIESNYDEALLEQDAKRSFALKQRIRGRHGHLSNEDAHNYLQANVNSRWEHVFFVHLSPECNCPTLVQQRAQALHQAGKTFTMEVIKPKEGPQGWFKLGKAGENRQVIQSEWIFN